MDVSYAPRAQVAAWLRKGWRLVPGHEYDASDWAIVMIFLGSPAELTDEQIDGMARQFEDTVTIPAEVGPNNLKRALAGLDRDRWGKFRRHDGAPASRRASRYDSRRLVQESA